jgi:hypothetical protein
MVSADGSFCSSYLVHLSIWPFALAAFIALLSIAFQTPLVRWNSQVVYRVLFGIRLQEWRWEDIHATITTTPSSSTTLILLSHTASRSRIGIPSHYPGVKDLAESYLAHHATGTACIRATSTTEWKVRTWIWRDPMCKLCTMLFVLTSVSPIVRGLARLATGS